MSANMVSPREKRFNFLPFDFNKHKFTLPYGIPQNIWLNQIQNINSASSEYIEKRKEYESEYGKTVESGIASMQ